jgi:hypothetical protein
MAISTLLLGLLIASPNGLAQQRSAAKRSGVDTPDLPVKREVRFETNFRARYLSVPNSILDIWFFDNDDDGSNPFARPKVKAYVVGAEFVAKKNPSNWIFYFEYLGNLIDEGYWDDVEQPPAHDDGDWIRPDGFGAIIVGANYGHEIYALPWWSFIFGGGVGIGGILGDLTAWSPGSSPGNEEEGCLSESPAYYRKDHCPADGTKRIPKVIPMLDISASTRIHFGDQANLRFDVGLHNMLYMGTAFGAVF